MNVRQGNMIVQEYGLKINSLSMYSLHMVDDFRVEMNKFLYRVLDLVKKEYKNAILLKDMNIATLVNHAQQNEGDKLREHAKKNMKDKTGNYEYSQ